METEAVVIKSILLTGRISGPADKYIDVPPGPNMEYVGKSYHQVNTFLKQHGREIVPEMIQHLPLIHEGIISASTAAGIYLYKNCLVLNEFTPAYRGVGQIIKAAVDEIHSQGIEEVFEQLKKESGLRWKQNWTPYEERRIPASEIRFLQYLPLLTNLRGK